MRQIKGVTFLVIFASVAVFLWMSQQQIQFDKGNLSLVAYAEPGHEAPIFQATSFADEQFNLSNDIGRMGTVLYFWTSWCPYCKASSQAVEKAYQTFTDDVKIIGVNVSHQDRFSDAETYIANHNLNFKNLIDEDGGISRSYFVPPIPTTLFIDHDGKITYRKMGAITFSELEQQINSLLREEF